MGIYLSHQQWLSEKSDQSKNEMSYGNSSFEHLAAGVKGKVDGYCSGSCFWAGGVSYQAMSKSVSTWDRIIDLINEVRENGDRFILYHLLYAPSIPTFMTVDSETFEPTFHEDLKWSEAYFKIKYAVVPKDAAVW